MSAAKLLLRLDLALFVTTASALTGYYHYQQRRPVRRASTRLHVSFRVNDDDNDDTATAETDQQHQDVVVVVSLPLIQELRTSATTRITPILGLLFAAAWCPDCNNSSGVVSAVGRIAAEQARTVDCVYVSSDTTEAEMLDFKPKSMRHIPFDNVELRTALKRQFRTCAAKEVSDVLGSNIPREHGIPTLILIDTETGRVLTTNGVNDVMHAESPAQVLRKWNGMLLEQDGYK